MSTERRDVPTRIADEAAEAIGVYLAGEVRVVGASLSTRTLLFPRDLAAAETEVVEAFIRSMARLTVADRDAIRPSIVVIRDLRQMGRNAFMALTATERDRLLYDAQAATTTILLAVLRE